MNTQQHAKFSPLKQQLNAFTAQQPALVCSQLPHSVKEHNQPGSNTQYAIAEVVGWQSPTHNTPLLLRSSASPKAFFCGGLSALQHEQLPHLIGDMIGLNVAFSYEGEDPNHKGCPHNVRFITLLSNKGNQLSLLEDKLNLMSEGSL